MGAGAHRRLRERLGPLNGNILGEVCLKLGRRSFKKLRNRERGTSVAGAMVTPSHCSKASDPLQIEATTVEGHGRRALKY